VRNNKFCINKKALYIFILSFFLVVGLTVLKQSSITYQNQARVRPTPTPTPIPMDYKTAQQIIKDFVYKRLGSYSGSVTNRIDETKLTNDEKAKNYNSNQISSCHYVNDNFKPYTMVDFWYREEVSSITGYDPFWDPFCYLLLNTANQKMNDDFYAPLRLTFTADSNNDISLTIERIYESDYARSKHKASLSIDKDKLAKALYETVNNGKFYDPRVFPTDPNAPLRVIKDLLRNSRGGIYFGVNFWKGWSDKIWKNGTFEIY